MLLPSFPLFTHLVCVIDIDSNMHSCDMFGDRTCISQALYRGSIQSGNRDNDTVVNILRMDWNIADFLPFNTFIMPMNCSEHQNKYGDQNDYDPGTFEELCRSND